MMLSLVQVIVVACVVQGSIGVSTIPNVSKQSPIAAKTSTLQDACEASPLNTRYFMSSCYIIPVDVPNGEYAQAVSECDAVVLDGKKSHLALLTTLAEMLAVKSEFVSGIL